MEGQPGVGDLAPSQTRVSHLRTLCPSNNRWTIWNILQQTARHGGVAWSLHHLYTNGYRGLGMNVFLILPRSVWTRTATPLTLGVLTAALLLLGVGYVVFDSYLAEARFGWERYCGGPLQLYARKPLQTMAFSLMLASGIAYMAFRFSHHPSDSR